MVLVVMTMTGCGVLDQDVRAVPAPATTTEPDPEAEFVGEVNRLCYSELQAFDGRSFTTWEVARDWLLLGKQIIDRITMRIGALTPPPGEEDAVARLVASLGQLSAILGQAEGATGPEQVFATYDQYDTAHRPVQEALDDYGLVGCNIR